LLSRCGDPDGKEAAPEAPLPCPGQIQVALVTALEECAGSASIRPTEPVQYIVVAIEHDRKYIPTHMSIPLLDDILLCDCNAMKLMA
jgi:hypothetical protein